MQNDREPRIQQPLAVRHLLRALRVHRDDQTRRRMAATLPPLPRNTVLLIDLDEPKHRKLGRREPMIERDDYRELDEWLDRSLTDRGKAGIAFLVIVALDILAWIVIIITVIELWRHLT